MNVNFFQKFGKMTFSDRDTLNNGKKDFVNQQGGPFSEKNRKKIFSSKTNGNMLKHDFIDLGTIICDNIGEKKFSIF